MKRFIPLAVMFLAAVALPSAFALSFSSWVETEGGWGGGTGGTLVREGQRGHQLESQHDAVYRCVSQKTVISRELLAGRLTLDEAVRHFHESEVSRDERLGKTPPVMDSAREALLLKRVMNWITAIAAHGDEAEKEMCQTLKVEYHNRLAGGSNPELEAG